MQVKTKIARDGAPRPVWSQEFLFTDIEPLCSGQSVLDAENIMLHVHTGLEIGLILNGAGFLWLGDRAIPFCAGDTYFLNPVVPHYHSCASGQKATMLWVHFPVDVATSVTPAKGDVRLLEPFMAHGADFNPIINANAQCAQLVPEIFNLYTMHNDFWEIASWAKIVLCLTEISAVHRTRFSAENSGDKKLASIAQALQFISANFTRSITIRDIAGACSLSPSRLSHVFARTIGATLMDYRNQMRIDLAVRLIRSSGRKLSDIAEECGFNSLSQFREIFKQVTGKTPGAIR